MMSSLVALRYSLNNSHSSNPFQSLRDFHGLVLAGRYLKAASLGFS